MGDAQSRVFMKTVFRNLFFYLILVAWTAVMPFALLCFWVQGLLGGRSQAMTLSPICLAARRVNHLYGAGWAYCIRPWARVSYSGPPGGVFPRPCIIVANHQSFFDIHCMGQTPAPNILFTVRSWPFRLPFYGFFMRLGRFINVEALDSQSILQRIHEEARANSVIVFFPEGHRNPAPDRDLVPGRFHAGAFAAAVAADLPVVPVCIRGTGTVLPPGGPWIYPGAINLQVLDPVYPAMFRDQGDNAARALRKHIQTAMRNCMQQNS